MEPSMLMQATDHGTQILIAIYMIVEWVVKPLIKRVTESREEPKATHEDLLGRMAACEQRIMSRLERIEHDARWLYEAHDRRDEDGVFVWYNKRRVEEGLFELIAVMKDVSKDLKRYLESDDKR